uniref:Uncharacterized protein n=1 Tax=Oryza meridionalis TaxID=40149 RepID=A0A0E0EX23_9ORYZ
MNHESDRGKSKTFKAKLPRREATTGAAANACPYNGLSQQSNIFNKDTAPTGIDVTDPRILGRVFARDSLERCKTSRKTDWTIFTDEHFFSSTERLHGHGLEADRPIEVRSIKEGGLASRKRNRKLKTSVSSMFPMRSKRSSMAEATIKGRRASGETTPCNCDNHLQLYHQHKEESWGEQNSKAREEGSSSKAEQRSN